MIDIESDQKILRKFFITNRSIYEIEFTKCEGEIKGIIKPNLKIDHKISNIEELFSNIIIKEKKEQKIKQFNKIKNKKGEELTEKDSIKKNTQKIRTSLERKSIEQRHQGCSEVPEKRTKEMYKEVKKIVALKECKYVRRRMTF